jgi:hypothetical protein
LDDVAQEIFQVGEWPCELLICPLVLLNCDFVEVDEAMFEGVGKTMRTRFLHPGHLKIAFEVLAEVIFQVGEWP